MSKKKAPQRTKTNQPIKATAESSKEQTLPKTTRYIFVGLTLLLPLALIGILELGLRAIGYGNNLRLARKVEENGKAWWEINQDVGQRYFGLQPEFARQAEEARIAYVKSSNCFRVICLGESSMAGFPYNKNATMPGILRTYLKLLLPDREIEVVNLGIAAVNSFAVRDLMHDVIALEPDVLLIYTGHNEFYGALGIGSTFFLGSKRNLINFYLRLLHYRTFYFLQEAIRNVSRLVRSGEENEAGPDKPVMQRMARQQTIPYGGDLFMIASKTFEQNLSDVLKMAKAAGVPVVVGNLVSNLKDQPPFLTAPATTLTGEEKGRWTEVFSAGLHLLTTGYHKAALEQFAVAARIDSMDAQLSYYMGKSFFASGDTNAAAHFFSRARDLDLLRFRAPDTFNVIIQEVCRQNDVPMVDVERTFRERCEGGIVGREYIAEHVHPTAHGYVLMAKAFLQGLSNAGLLPAPADSHHLVALSESLDKLKITVLDEEIGRLRILNLTSAWPFKQPVNLTLMMDAQIKPLVQELARRYINREISWGEAHLDLAQNLVKMKKYDAALAEFHALVEHYPNEFSLFDKIGETLISLQRYQEAVAAFSRSIQLKADSPYARAGIGRACMFLARYQEAEAAFAEAIKLDDETSNFSVTHRSVVFYLWGGALTNLRRYTQAEEKFVEAVRLNPGNVLANNFLATLRSQLQKSARKIH